MAKISSWTIQNVREQLLAGQKFRHIAARTKHSEQGLRDAMAAAGHPVDELIAEYRAARLKRILAAVARKETLEQIAEREGMSKPGVYKLLRRTGNRANDYRADRSRDRASRKAEALRLRQELRMSTAEIATRLGVSPTTVNIYLTEARGRVYKTYSLAALRRAADLMRHGKTLQEAADAENMKPQDLGMALRRHLGVRPTDLIAEGVADRKALVFGLRRGGKTPTEIAKATGLPVSTVALWCRRQFGPMRSGGARGEAKKRLDARVMALAKQGMPAKAIAVEVGRAEDTVRGILRLQRKAARATVSR